MVKNSSKTYGEHMLKARSQTDRQEVGATLEPLMDQFKRIIEEIVQKEYDKGLKGKYYIHIWIQKEPYAANSLHIYPMSRRTRPSPYQGHDHYLWSVEDGGKVTFLWCIPNKQTLSYILNNPGKFDHNYVRMLKNYCSDKIEQLSDYLVDGKIA
jgi:hypothetical protein